MKALEKDRSRRYAVDDVTGRAAKEMSTTLLTSQPTATESAAVKAGVNSLTGANKGNRVSKKFSVQFLFPTVRSDTCPAWSSASTTRRADPTAWAQLSTARPEHPTSWPNSSTVRLDLSTMRSKP